MTMPETDRAGLRSLCERQDDLLAERRTVEHWRRLVTARIDLAVAAVTEVDEPRAAAGGWSGAPEGLSSLLGLARGEQALGETALLPRLRGVLGDLDRQAEMLRLLELDLPVSLDRPSTALGPVPRPRSVTSGGAGTA